MIIIINGALGVGKSSVGDALNHKFQRSFHLDGDYIGDVNPFEIYDDARVTYLYQTLAHLIIFHQAHHYQDFVINYVFESAASLQEMISLLTPLDSDIHTFWLTCEPGEMEKRIQARGRVELDWELKRFLELQKIQYEASLKGFIGNPVETSMLTTQEVADLIWKEIHQA